MVFPFLADDGKERLYYFMSLISSEEDGFENRLFTNVITATQYGEDDPFKEFPLKVVSFVPKIKPDTILNIRQ